MVGSGAAIRAIFMPSSGPPDLCSHSERTVEIFQKITGSENADIGYALFIVPRAQLTVGQRSN
jgi:hypothetical protein